MKMLLIGNSTDVGDWFEGGQKRHEIVRDRLEAEFGEPVEIITRQMWPNERMGGLVARWLDEIQPDAVYLIVTTFPFSYESLPLRMKRLLGPLGGPVGDAGLRFAGSKRWTHNALFRAVRRLGQATIGGDTHFTCDEVIERVSASVRLVLRREGTLLIVRGPLGRGETGMTGREHRRKEAKRLLVHSALQRLCADLHVPYVGSETPFWRDRPAPQETRIGDGLHSNALGHERLADEMFVDIRDAWAEHRSAPVAGKR